MTSNVQLSRLGDLLEVTSSKRIHMADYVSSGIPFYRSKEIIELSKGNRITTELFIEPNHFEKLKKNFGCPSRDDILLTSVGTLGVPYIVDGDEDFYFKDGNLTWMRNFSEKISPKFLYYWLTSPATQRKLDEISIGSTQKALTISSLKSLEIPLPSRSTQNGIVEILNAFSQRITVLRETNATLEHIAQGLFKSWFVDFDPVRAKSEGKLPEGMDEVTAAFFPDALQETEMGIVPRGWSAGELGDILDLRNERTKPSQKTQELPYVPIDCISAKVPFLEQYKSGESANSSLVFFHKGDILFGAMRPYFHKVCIAPFDGTTRTTVFTLKSKNQEATGFALFQLFQNETVQFATNHAEGSTIPYAKWYKSLETMPITIPPESLQKIFSEIAMNFVEGANLNIEKINSLANLRDTLLPRLISGQLRIADAETEFEKVTA
jgi:type I restriction enzyme S subunit